MKILHYSLGLPPFRRGGMVKYCDDLMVAEKGLGNNVYLLYPGILKDRTINTKIKAHGPCSIDGTTIDNVYEIINPLPVPLIDGIRDVNLFMLPKKAEKYNDFFQQNHFDILHVHTLMGLPSELILAAKNHGVKLIFTSHDYFPICPRVFLFHDGVNCICDHGGKDCIYCNRNAFSFKKMVVLQSDFYRSVKNTRIVRALRYKHNKNNYDFTSDSENSKSSEIQNANNNCDQEAANGYLHLREKNVCLLNSFDCIHFNSKNTQQIYAKYGIGKNNGIVINITNGSICDHRQTIKLHDIIQIGYLGPAVTHKGFDLLLNVCDRLWSEGMCNFHLHTYILERISKEYVTNHGPYQYSDLPEVMNRMDLLVVPSVCGETYGFTTIEAQSYGVPAIVSSMVGAKDIIIPGVNGDVFEPTADSLYSTLLEILKDKEMIKRYNHWIISHDWNKTMNQHANEMLDLYKKI